MTDLLGFGITTVLLSPDMLLKCFHAGYTASDDENYSITNSVNHIDANALSTFVGTIFH